MGVCDWQHNISHAHFYYKIEMINCALIVLVLLISASPSMPYPSHASCEGKWTIPTSCEEFKNKIINQMRAWEGDELCPPVSEDCPSLPCGQRCLYNFTSYEDLTIIGTHLTPKHRYAVLDFGTNYCNLR